MNEWTVVTVIIGLVGLVAAIIKPLISLNSTITRLTKSVDTLEKQLSQITEKNSESHARIWHSVTAQDERLRKCECRLGVWERN